VSANGARYIACKDAAQRIWDKEGANGSSASGTESTHYTPVELLGTVVDTSQHSIILSRTVCMRTKYVLKYITG
jgi:hypothetical protein